MEEKNRMIEKKTQAAMQAQQERNRMNTELTEIKDHMDIKDRKINVLQRKVSHLFYLFQLLHRGISFLEVQSKGFVYFRSVIIYFPHFNHFCSSL